jgi:hypothetical protein
VLAVAQCAVSIVSTMQGVSPALATLDSSWLMTGPRANPAKRSPMDLIVSTPASKTIYIDCGEIACSIKNAHSSE